MEEIKYFHQPSISESLGNGWYVMKKYFLWLFLAVIITAIVSGPMRYTFDGTDNIHGGMILLMIIGFAFALMVSPVIKYGSKMMFLQGVKDQEPDIKWLFSGFKTNYLNIVLANLLHFAIVAIGFVFLIIPGILFACRLAFVSYLVMDKGLDPVRAIEESWRLTQGHGWTILGLAVISFFIIIIGLACIIVGIFPALIWIEAAFASLYQAIIIEREQSIEM